MRLCAVVIVILALIFVGVRSLNVKSYRISLIPRQRKLSAVGQREEEDFDFADSSETFVNDKVGSKTSGDEKNQPSLPDEEPTNRAVSFLKSFYESIFFYGLDVEPVNLIDKGKKEEVLNSEGFNAFKRRSFLNPFFTKSELLALYLMEQQKAGKKVDESRRNKADVKSKGRPVKSLPAMEGDLFEEVDIKEASRDTKSFLKAQKKRIEEQISTLQRELKVIEVTLATVADEDDEEDVDELRRSEQKLAWQIEEAKVNLVTIEAELIES
eukprot:gene36850-44701_t